MSRHMFVCILAIASVVRVEAQQQLPTKDKRIEELLNRISAANIRASIEKLVSFGTRHTLSDTAGATRGIGAARRWIKSEFERYAATSGGRLTVAYDPFVIPQSQRTPNAVAGVNVVATLHPRAHGSELGSRTIIISGHYDSRATDVMDATSDAPGADDDGSGTALVLELARVMATLDTRSTVKFVCYTGEEQGLFGSLHYAESTVRDGIEVEAVFNNDIVGGIRGENGEVDSASVRVFSAAFSQRDTGGVFMRRNALGLENDGASRSLARYISETGALYVPGFIVRMVYRGDRFLRGGDHVPFHQRGNAAVRFSESKENFDHQHQNVRVEKGVEYGDNSRFVNVEYCARIARVNAAAAASIALAPSMPGDAGILVSGLAYDTRLRWKGVHEPGVAGYLVRWRETTSSVWEHSLFTQDTAVTVNASKDDVLFGVQTVDDEGDTSLYAIPTVRK